MTPTQVSEEVLPWNVHAPVMSGSVVVVGAWVVVVLVVVV